MWRQNKFLEGSIEQSDKENYESAQDLLEKQKNIVKDIKDVDSKIKELDKEYKTVRESIDMKVKDQKENLHDNFKSLSEVKNSNLLLKDYQLVLMMNQLIKLQKINQVVVNFCVRNVNLVSTQKSTYNIIIKHSMVNCLNAVNVKSLLTSVGSWRTSRNSSEEKGI